MRPTEGIPWQPDELSVDSFEGIYRQDEPPPSPQIQRLTDLLQQLDRIERELDALIETAPVG